MFTQQERMTYIGGSDIAAIMSQSRWKTPYRLWAEKTGKIEIPDLSNVESVEMGTRLEQFVADVFSEKTGKAIRKAPKAYSHPDYPYLVAHVDRLVTGTDELLECKTCSAYKLEEWENKIPKEYVLQVVWYLGITGRKKGWIACLIGGQKFVYMQIDFDEELFNLMVEKAVKFWDMVQNKIPPLILPEDDDVLGEIYSEHTDDMMVLQDLNDRVSGAVARVRHRLFGGVFQATAGNPPEHRHRRFLQNDVGRRGKFPRVYRCHHLSFGRNGRGNQAGYAGSVLPPV